MALTADNVQTIYGWYCIAMRQEGYKVTPPKGTDFTKTYHFRAVNLFAKRMDEEGFSEDTVRAIVKSVVRYGKQHKLLNSKSINILNMKSVVDICWKDLQKRDAVTKDIIDSIRSCHQYLLERGFTTADALIQPVSLGGMSKLNFLVETGALPAIYMAVSRKIAAAIERVDRSRLPSDDDLMKIRAKLVLNHTTRTELKSILGPDFNTAGLPRSIAC